MKKDPLSIINSMVLNLNLLEPYQEYNINELKFVKDLDLHWITIKKYLKIISIIQNYAPLIEIKESKFTIVNSDIYNRLNDKEKSVISLVNKKATNIDSAIEIPLDYKKTINDSIGYLFEKTSDNRIYLNEVGLDLYKSIKQDILNLIYEEKSLNDVFFEKEDFFGEIEFSFWTAVSIYDTQEGSIEFFEVGKSFSDIIKNEKEITITI